MQKITYKTLSLTEALALTALELDALDPPVLDADEDPAAEPFSFVLPYWVAQQCYMAHVEGCPSCLDSPVWDIGCEEGNRLAHEAADAMSAQDAQAAQN